MTIIAFNKKFGMLQGHLILYYPKLYLLLAFFIILSFQELGVRRI